MKSEKVNKKANDFYRELRSNIDRWGAEGTLPQKAGDWTDPLIQYIMVLPDLIHLLTKLFLDKNVPLKTKLYIIGGVGYLFSPVDILPDIVPGIGLIDDLLVTVVVLHKIINSSDPVVRERIQYHWCGKDDVFQTIREIAFIATDLGSEIPKWIHRFMTKKP